MRKDLILVMALFLAALASFSRAEKESVNFDQGVDASALLSTARANASKQFLPLPLSKRKLKTLKRKMSLSIGSGVYQPVSPLVKGSANYPLGVNLRIDPKYLALPPAALQPLEEKWTDIGSVRSDLLSQASEWDGTNEQLYVDGQQLEIDRGVLNKRQADLNTEIGQYNQACTTHPLPPEQYQQCVAWRSDLIGRQGVLDGDFDTFNGRVNTWNQQSSAIFEKRKTLMTIIQDWENQILQWLDSANKAIAAQCRPLATLESLPPSASVLTGGFTQEFEAKTTFKNEPKDAPPCEVDLLWTLDSHTGDPDKILGFVSPTAGRKTTFKSAYITGLGTVVLQDRNSGLGTGSTVNLVNPSK